MFVLDCSITMAWLFADEKTTFTEQILANFSNTTAIVPTIWYYEVSNVLIVAERKKRITPAQSTHFWQVLHELPIKIDTNSLSRNVDSILYIARDHDLSSYDAAYIDLALHLALPIASLDKKILQPARTLGLTILK